MLKYLIAIVAFSAVLINAQGNFSTKKKFNSNFIISHDS